MVADAQVLQRPGDLSHPGNPQSSQLAAQGTHPGPLHLPQGMLPPTGKRMDAPCCDVFRIVNGKIQSFNCYPSGTVIFAQLGVLSNIEAAIAASSTTRT